MIIRKIWGGLILDKIMVKDINILSNISKKLKPKKPKKREMKTIENKGISNPGFNKDGEMIIYRYFPRCLYCSKASKGKIYASKGGTGRWQCRECGKVTYFAYHNIIAPKF